MACTQEGMAVVGNTIINKFLTLSEAEEAFLPWWDTMEDYFVYGVIILGKTLNRFKIMYSPLQNSDCASICY